MERNQSIRSTLDDAGSCSGGIGFRAWIFSASWFSAPVDRGTQPCSDIGSLCDHAIASTWCDANICVVRICKFNKYFEVFIRIADKKR